MDLALKVLDVRDAEARGRQSEDRRLARAVEVVGTDVVEALAGQSGHGREHLVVCLVDGKRGGDGVADREGDLGEDEGRRSKWEDNKREGM